MLPWAHTAPNEKQSKSQAISCLYKLLIQQEYHHADINILGLNLQQQQKPDLRE